MEPLFTGTSVWLQRAFVTLDNNNEGTMRKGFFYSRELSHKILNNFVKYVVNFAY